MSKEYEYPEEFESIWKKIDKTNRATRKELGYKTFLRTKARYHNPDIQEQLKEKNKWIKELLNNSEECPTCGTTEFLCGHKGVGCSHESM